MIHVWKYILKYFNDEKHLCKTKKYHYEYFKNENDLTTKKKCTYESLLAKAIDIFIATNLPTDKKIIIRSHFLMVV